MSTTLAFQRVDNIDRYMAEINRYPLLSRDDEESLAKRFYEHGDVSAAHRLVVANLRFVVRVAHEYRGYGLKLLDLIQEGNVGLMIAVKKFDPYRGYRLISYAVWWIRASMQDFIMRSWSLVRMGATRLQRKLFFRLRSERAKAEQQDLAVSSRELAERLDVKEADVTAMELRLAGRDFSLDATLNHESHMSHLDMVPHEGVSQEEALIDRQQQEQLRNKVQEVMTRLNDKERYVVEKRLLSDKPATLQEIGDFFKVSRERVRQIESGVVRKLRSSIARETL